MRKPDYEALKRIADCFDVSTDFLLNVRSGNCNNSDAVDLLHVFHSMTAEQQRIVIEQDKVFVWANTSSKGMGKVKSP